MSDDQRQIDDLDEYERGFLTGYVEAVAWYAAQRGDAQVTAEARDFISLMRQAVRMGLPREAYGDIVPESGT